MAEKLVEFDLAVKQELVSVKGMADINLGRVFRRGNTRKFRALTPKQQAKMPEQVTLRKTVITHEIETVDDNPLGSVHTRFMYTPNFTNGDLTVAFNNARYGEGLAFNSQLPSEAYVLMITNNGKLAGRTPGSSVICLRNADGNHRFFYVITWTDLFGHSIKENAVNRLRREGAQTENERTIKTQYTYEAIETHDLMRRSVSSFFDQFWPAPGSKLDAVEPEWLTSTVVALIGEAQKGEQVHPILADALQDAGCESELYLNHLREPGITHHPDCWVLHILAEAIPLSSES